MIPSRKIMGCLHEPEDGGQVFAVMRVEGWVLCRAAGRPELQFVVDGKPMQAEISWQARPDVFQVHQNWDRDGNPEPGFIAEIPTILLPPGTHTLKVSATLGSSCRIIAKRTFSIPPPEPPPASDTSPSSTVMPRERILFLHIPKTAGTSLNAYLRSQYPPSAIAMHVESPALGRPWQPDDFADKKLVAGHLNYDTFSRLLDVDRYFRITVLREPRRQVLSQLAWLKRLSAPESESVRNGLGPVFQGMINRMAEVGPVRFLETLSGLEIEVFYNAQSRLLVTKAQGDALDDSFLLSVFDRLASFDLVGLTEQLDDFLHLLAFHMGWRPAHNIPRLNLARPAHYENISDHDEALAIRIDAVTALDRRLYDHAKTMFDRQMQGMISTLYRDHQRHREALLDPATRRQALVDVLQLRAEKCGRR